MVGRGRYRNNRHHHHQTLSSVARETVASLPSDSPVMTMFKQAVVKLNDRQDRHERLVKLSRDITIESKRIIFLLHSAINEETTEKALKEANERLNKLVQGPIQTIGLELENRPAYLHSKAVTAGFQEFIEARTLCSLMETKNIIKWADVQKEFQYTINKDDEERTVVTMLTHLDYMLGIADLTGELMRRAINSISSGEGENCFFICQVVRDLFTGFLGLYGSGNELTRKLYTTRSNVAKVESAVYALRVRGGEAPATLLLARPRDWDPGTGHSDTGTGHSDDEGFY